MRDAQGRAAAAAAVPIATTIDLGADPQPAAVAPRIARTILSAAYKNTPDATVGPELASAETVDDTIRLRMKCRNGGLATKAASAAGTNPSPAGFAIAASPFRWVWAKAEVNGDTIVLSAPGIKAPQAARYAYEDLPSHGATLVDSAGNPAAPFRTDRFYELSSEVVSPGDKPQAYDVRTVMIEDPLLPRILMLGDSISGGYFPGVRQRLDGLATVLGETAFTGQGKAKYRFYTSPAALKDGGLATFLAERGPFDIVHFNMGIHEFAWVNAPNYLKGKKLTEADPANVKTESDAYAARLRDVVALIRKAGAAPVFATSTATKADGVIAHFPYYFSNCQAFNAAAERTMRELAVPVVDIYGLIQPRIEEFISGDLIHFKSEASTEMATLIASQLKEQLGTLPRRDGAAPGKRHDLSARASQIDPLAKEHPEIGFMFNDDKGKPMDLQHAVVDTSVPPQGKLVIWLMDHSQPLFERISSYGLHGIQVHYANRWFGGLKPEVRDSGDVLGRIRLEASTGEDASPLVDIPKPDGMAERSRQFLLWLDREHPDGRWAQFLTADRKDLRWEKVTMAGISHGATTAARFAVHKPVDRVVMLSGPRDNTETWQGMPSATPANRFFGFSHVLDSGWTADHYCRSWQLLRLNEFGPVVNVDEVPSPYGNTRRLITTADVDKNPGRAHTTVVPGGSSVKNAAGAMIHEPVWRYLFTHPVEQTGAAVPPDADCAMDRQTAHGVPPTAPAPAGRP
jgi:lysophospholipase L1-like esterase